MEFNETKFRMFLGNELENIKEHGETEYYQGMRDGLAKVIAEFDADHYYENTTNDKTE